MNDMDEDWEPEQVELYEKMMRFALPNQHLFTWPNATQMPNRPEWLTICHNMAYLAASIMDGSDFKLKDLDTKQELISTEKGPLQ